MVSVNAVRVVAVLFLAALFVPSGALVLGAGGSAARATTLSAASGTGAPSGPSATGVAPAVSGPIGARVHALEQALLDRGVPSGDLHLPNLAGEVPRATGPVQPRFSTGPAPMGISDLGLRNESGALVPYEYNTSSVWGRVNLTRAESAYVDGDGPDTFGLQLDAVATNITLLGVPGYEFWTQDYASYTPSTHHLTFGDNVWNFSSASEEISSNVFASTGPNGTLESPYFYYATGPTFTVAYPFTLSFYLNASLARGLPTVWFNYSVTNRSGSVGSGSFDHVTFNATGSDPATGVEPPAFQVNGERYDPVGLPNDVELVLVGDGNGDTTTFFEMNATLALRTWNASTGSYAVVPAAFDAGSDAGETSNGILPTYTTPLLGGAPTVTVGVGPSFVEGLWNVSSALEDGRSFLVAQDPENAFLFVSPGTPFNASLAQWVPTLRFGAPTSDFTLPCTGAFTLRWMLSDHTPFTDNLSGPAVCLSAVPMVFSVTLANDTGAGGYTPLLAWGNGDLASINESGKGTLANPYVLFHSTAAPLNPVFGQLNDFGYPVFAGVFLAGTTSHVRVTDPPTSITYGAWMASQLATLGVPSTNGLQVELWDTSNVTVDDSIDLGGWLTDNLGLYPAGEVILWGSSDDLVASDTFHDQGVAVALFGGTDNTVWGNTIVQGAVGPDLYDGTNTTGILEAESGDLVYNNYLAVPRPAVTPTVDLVSCQAVCAPATYSDRWNTTLEPANVSVKVLGSTLTGSILDTWYQGGNYWSNYGTPSNPFGVLPYTDSGEITVGGDYHPLYPSTIYSVTFAETGLASPVPWNETTLGLTSSSTSTTIVTSLPNGTFNYTIGAPTGYVGPGTGSLVVSGSNVTVAVPFVELFTENLRAFGLVAGWTWTVTFNVTAGGTSPTGPTGTNASVTSTAGQTSVALENGTYAVTASAYGYASAVAETTVTVDGSAPADAVVFTLIPILTVTATGLSTGTPWTATVSQHGGQVSETGVGDGVLVFTVLEINPGRFSWSVSAPNYQATPSTGGGNAPTPSTAVVVFSATPGAAPPFDWLEVALVALAAVAALGFVLFAVERRRGRRSRPPRPPVRPAPAVAAAAPAAATVPPSPGAPTPWDESVTDQERAPASAPWEEAPDDSERPPSYSRKP